jgi:transcriptional regulator with XRE-family HTH domain
MVSGKRLRAGLRDARRDARMTQNGAGQRLRWSPKKIYRIESGETPPSRKDVTALASMYGLDPARTQELVELAEESYGAPWWGSYRQLVSAEFGLFLSCERAGVELSYFQPSIIHGLIQVESYARAILSATSNPMELTRRARLRAERRIIFQRDEPPQATILLGEAALHNRVGSTAVMSEQLAELSRLALTGGSPKFGVVPFEGSAYPAMLIGFDLVRLPDNDVTLYLELPPVSRTTKDEETLNDLYGSFFAQIRERAVFGSEAAILVDAALEKQRARGDRDQR